jgi:hypothetical protein
VADVTRNIGLSLGADLCWPACYESIMRRLDLKLPLDGDTITFDVERVFIEPYDLRRDCKYDVVIDRVTHWLHTSREWIKKAVLMNDLYVFNNPWAIQSMEKHTSYCAMMHLGMRVPETWMVPPKRYPGHPDTDHTLSQYAKLFDLGKLGEIVGYPLFVKPYDGGGWRSVRKCDDDIALKDAYEKSETDVMHVQAAIAPYDAFVRSIGFGPQVLHVKYDPAAPLHDRYQRDRDGITDDDFARLRKITLTINTFFGWEFNSCESLLKDGIWHPMDFANACPDSQVTSLHYHFPWLVKAYIKWSVFCAATKRKMRRTLDWEPYYEVAASDGDFYEKLDRYAAIADERLETDRFEEFCDKHLSHLDEVTHEFFGTDEARTAIRAKVAALYPQHEIDEFTELFWQRIQDWRRDAEGEAS